MSDEMANEGARAVADTEIECPGCGWSVMECLADKPQKCPCRELHEAARGMEHVLGLMRERVGAADREVFALKAEVASQRSALVRLPLQQAADEREIARTTAALWISRKGLEDIAAADRGGPILDAGSAAKRAAWALERLDRLMPGDDPKADEVKRLTSELAKAREEVTAWHRSTQHERGKLAAIREALGADPEAERFRVALKLIAGCCARYRAGACDMATKSCREDGTPRPMMCAPCKASDALGLPVDR